MIRLRFGTTILQVRRSAACIGAACVLVCFGAVYIYFSRLLPSSTGMAGWPPGKVDMAALEQRLQRLEKELRNNHVMLNPDPGHSSQFPHWWPWSGLEGRPQGPPALQNLPPASIDYNVYDLYEKIAFDNPDGGVWKQGWKLEYEESMWTKDRKLRVFVVPHSTNPGWLKTFDKYYLDQTRHILDNMATKLGVDKRRRFIWAETSYLSHWFDQQSEDIKSKVRGYVQSGQLEIVTGGWVMNDEANTHVFAMLEQMVEGHQWVERNLGKVPCREDVMCTVMDTPCLKLCGTQKCLHKTTAEATVRPRNGWAIDPLAFFHNAIPSQANGFHQHGGAESPLLDQNKTTDILCHMMPFYSYDVPHTCGPDPKICCQFDFKRLPGNKINCPWKVPPVAITDHNVADRAMLLLDQYRKKSLLFRTHVVLVPLGDDFRFDKSSEWDNQFNNYQKLFDYINANERLHAEVQFGTLEDYFVALRAESTVDSSNMPIGFPSLSGDFFTYADRDDNYWSGYYTSRPFYKNMDRTVEAHLRGAEIMFSLVWARMGYIFNDYMPLVNSMMNGLVTARQNLGLFQHHDGITGTAKNPVVIDYGVRLFKSLQHLREIITKGALYMLLNAPSQGGIEDDLFVLQMDDVRDTYDGMPRKQLLTFTREGRIRYVVFYNSLTVPRSEIVNLQVSTASIVVIDANGSVVPSQLSPVWNKEELIRGTFELSFQVDVPPLGLPLRMKKATLCVYFTPAADIYFPIALRFKGRFSYTDPYLAATFSPTTGMLKHVLVKDQNVSLDIESLFVKYGTRPKNKDRSGAYLFLPDEKAR
ncbi:alpha-mannosidase 2x-like, partial [Dermacentor silvarum]|uniref:alpha-mannosidase 2x-like n=1 Tax=Dermacentor silvarum TaxID=543639 RepID=UPI002100E305